ncbi:hypothetical protein GCM10007416_32220 [Kroppenstedtia guangzhouensis]|uniref:Uncharacterized protein n=1 Tax=Kroppenstedtia guangzhouensis TaxID=1274356 RepID=A0ABQ1H2I2_9BACL|nr:hypothetical protein [Kroppenstedtia guangzhouensis]GGA56568.1 hypothetical protein GCM10007416_32220 [Kroppenstedtia guangzhouensis]
MNGSFLNACRVLYLEIVEKDPGVRTEAEIDFVYHFVMLPRIQQILENEK